MRVMIRADASSCIGTGHIMRCLTLAEQLRDEGYEVTFICRDYPGNMIEFIRHKNFDVCVLPFFEKEAYMIQASGDHYQQWLWVNEEVDANEVKALFSSPVDWLVVDHYSLDASWEKQLRPWAKKILVIDDIANRKHDCDLLLDQNYYLGENDRYQHLVPSFCRLLLGPTYALLRAPFLEHRLALRHRDGKIKRILIFFSGVDVENCAQRALSALLSVVDSTVLIDIVVSASNKHQAALLACCEKSHHTIYLHSQIDYMAQLMEKADLYIGAGGSVSWERCCLGLPALVFSTGENQILLSESLSQYGAVVYLGVADEKLGEKILLTFPVLFKNTHKMQQMTMKGLQLVDGRGVMRVMKEMKA